jgi:hypothetical protein
MTLAKPQSQNPEAIMNAPSFDLDEEKFNMEIRKFLKKVGITRSVRSKRGARWLKAGKLKGGECLNAQMTLEIVGLDLRFTIDGEIALN